MDAYLPWFALALLVSAWARIRHWSRLAREAPALQPELNARLARRSALVIAVSWLGSLNLPGLLAGLGLPVVLPDRWPALLDFVPLVLLVWLSSIPALPLRRRVLGETWGVLGMSREQLGLMLGFLAGYPLLPPVSAMGRDHGGRSAWGPLAAAGAVTEREGRAPPIPRRCLVAAGVAECERLCRLSRRRR